MMLRTILLFSMLLAVGCRQSAESPQSPAPASPKVVERDTETTDTQTPHTNSDNTEIRGTEAPVTETPANQSPSTGDDDELSPSTPTDEDVDDADAQRGTVTLTEAAGARLQTVLKQVRAKHLRVSLDEDGQYDLAPEKEVDSDSDLVSVSHGVSIVIDRDDATQIAAGTVIHFRDDEGSSGFEFLHELTLTPPDTSRTLAQARAGYKTRRARRETSGESVPEPPPEIFQLVKYDSPVGKLAAYVSPDPQDGKRHPAIIWIHGGECNSIGELWEESPRDNDQTARAYRDAGIVMMSPSLRGGNENPGIQEGFYGEVDDLLAAADYLAAQKFVDPARIYLGGHSTGGTLVLLVAECSDRFRAVVSFGPADSLLGYPRVWLPFDFAVRKEFELRAPSHWLHGIRSPVFVIEGEAGNATAHARMAKLSTNPQVKFLLVEGADHFNVLAPTNELIAKKILEDTGEKCNLQLEPADLNALFAGTGEAQDE
jgi:acetyl esterase/lipase